MPICPKCGSPRIDRYCAFCGAATTQIPPPLPAPGPPAKTLVKAKASRPRLLPFFLFFGLLGAALMIFMGVVSFQHVASPATPALPAAPVILPTGEIKAFLSSFEKEADDDLNMDRISLSAVMRPANVTDSRLTGLKSQLDSVANLRENMARAQQRARLENDWPVQVGGYTFSYPRQIQAAIKAADDYMARGGIAEQELARVSEQNHRVQDNANRMLDQMQQICAEVHLDATGQKSSTMDSLRDLRGEFLQLHQDFGRQLRNIASIDWSRANLAPFTLN